MTTTDHLSPKQIGAELDIPPRRVRSWIAAGTLPAIQLGPRTLRVKRSDLDAFVAKFPYVQRVYGPQTRYRGQG